VKGAPNFEESLCRPAARSTHQGACAVSVLSPPEVPAWPAGSVWAYSQPDRPRHNTRVPTATPTIRDGAASRRPMTSLTAFFFDRGRGERFHHVGFRDHEGSHGHGGHRFRGVRHRRKPLGVMLTTGGTAVLAHIDRRHWRPASATRRCPTCRSRSRRASGAETFRGRVALPM
jgi:hypothetical protein